VCTDAAGEGLNLQFAGVLANYDLPWNPMKVEQRIGRIDRLGQKHERIRVLNFAYKDTVEEDVFFAVGSRINLFQGIVGRLQPIFSRLPKRFEELSLAGRETREAERQRFIAELGQQVDEAERSGFDIDATSAETLELPSLPAVPASLRDLDRVLQTALAIPAQADVWPLDPGSYAVTLPGGEAIRVTTDAETFDISSDNHQLFAPGGQVFEALMKYAVSDMQSHSSDAEAVSWLVTQVDGGTTFVVKTESGLERVESLAALLQCLERVGSPTRFPYAEWPGVSATAVA